MKLILGLFLSALTAAVSMAGPAEDEIARAHGRADAIALLRQGKVAESKQNLTATQDRIGPATDVTLGNQWVRIAFHLHARGEWPLAKQAAGEVLAHASAAAKANEISSERAAFLTNAGLLCERILRNRAQAKIYYAAAAFAQPAAEDAKRKLRIVDEKITGKAVGKNAGS